jgi:molybdopterin synthase sulfur carrier subunit
VPRLAAGSYNRLMKLLYFAWVRERIGRGEETLAVPDDVETVADLVGWLRSRGPEYEAALAEAQAVRVALDKVHAPPGASIRGAAEAALFPPMTGG